MKVSEQFKSTIKAYLDNMAAVDSLFAPVYQKPTKKKVCQNAHLLFFTHKAPTFTSWGFVIT